MPPQADGLPQEDGRVSGRANQPGIGDLRARIRQIDENRYRAVFTGSSEIIPFAYPAKLDLVATSEIRHPFGSSIHPSVSRCWELMKWTPPLHAIDFAQNSKDAATSARLKTRSGRQICSTIVLCCSNRGLRYSTRRRNCVTAVRCIDGQIPHRGGSRATSTGALCFWVGG